MIKLYLKYKKYRFFFGIVLILVIAFLIYYPSIKAFYSRSLTKNFIQLFIRDTTSKGLIDPQQFWYIREFSSPGSFYFEREGLTKNKLQNALSAQNITFEDIDSYPFLTFSSKKWNSIELLVEETTSNEKVMALKKYCQKLIFESKYEFICPKNDKTIFIVFLKTLEEMAKANAYFDVAGRDGKIVDGKSWLVISSVNL